MNLRESIRQWVLANLPYDSGDASLVAHLNGLDAHRLLVVYHNWINRLVKPQPRTVHSSEAFQRNPLTVQLASDVSQIIDDIEQGIDLTKYLSRDIERAVTQIPGQSWRRDLDLMLNSWGVHHLHISTELEPDGFVRRDRSFPHLLFVVFKPRAAYVVDIMLHGDWTRDHVLEVLADEWANEGIVHEMNGERDNLPTPLTERDREVLRTKRVNSAFEFRGRVYIPSGMLMASGFTFDAVREADCCLESIEFFPTSGRD